MKKVFSLLLAVLMLVSALPVAYAAETADYTVGTHVVYTAANNEDYTITVPAALAPGGSGTVTLEGAWAADTLITVTAQENVKLTNSINAADTKTLAVSFAGISEFGSNTESQKFTESVSVDPIENAIFGTWDGHFYYYVGTVVEAIETAGLYGADGSFTPWSTLVADGTLVVTDGVLTSGFYMNSDKDYGNTSAETLSGNLLIDNTVTSLGESAFDSCPNLNHVAIPDSVTEIGDYAFYNCENLTEIIIPDSVTSIGEGAFGFCTNLTSIDIPDSVTEIGDYAFCNCYLTEIIIPDSVTSIGESAFEGTRLTSIDIPDSVTEIGDSAFYNCFDLTEIIIPDSVTSIGEGAFSNCYSLTSITIPNNVTSINFSTFSTCKNLIEIIIPDSVTTINKSAFYECTNLSTINFSGTTSQWAAITFGDIWNYNVPATEVICSDGTVALS